tara:strand:+ start:28926 stop:29165 length:240 start_codon:yes stop_codon:yes gene_type:complete
LASTPGWFAAFDRRQGLPAARVAVLVGLRVDSALRDGSSLRVGSALRDGSSLRDGSALSDGSTDPPARTSAVFLGCGPF